LLPCCGVITGNCKSFQENENSFSVARLCGRDAEAKDIENRRSMVVAASCECAVILHISPDVNIMPLAFNETSAH
jgi:hypothetical protein